MPLYDIKMKNTFLEFKPVDLSNEQCFRKTLSCPCLSFIDDAPAKSGAEDRTDSSTLLPEVASSVSTDSDVPTAPAKDAKPEGVVGKFQQGILLNSPMKDKNRSSKSALAMQMKLNKQLMQANYCSKPDIFTLVRTQIHRMNAVNLSTAMHRIARLGGPLDQNHTPVLEALLNAIQKQTLREIESQDGSMPASCATIIAWSCASLQAQSHFSERGRIGALFHQVFGNIKCDCMCIWSESESEPGPACQ